jgi:tRNA (mo5U34)-methyltransferase
MTLPMETLTPMARDVMEFDKRLRIAKEQLEPPTFWYPYDTLGNLINLGQLETGDELTLETLRGLTIADIGAADGDMAFYLESLGNRVDIVDHGPTNFNGLRGAARMKEHLGSSVTISDVDLDDAFTLPRERYDVAFLFGILYHLKNPFNVMERLARRARTCFLSTKVAKYAGSPAQPIASLPVAYLLAPGESNNDPTTFWIFSDAGLKRLLDRAGWEVVSYTTTGDVHGSDPAGPKHDERAFCYLRSRCHPA